MCVLNTVANVRSISTTQSPPVIACVILIKAKILTMLYKVLHDVDCASLLALSPAGLLVHPASVMLAMM